MPSLGCMGQEGVSSTINYEEPHSGVSILNMVQVPGLRVGGS
jgi:hypothetical protein